MRDDSVKILPWWGLHWWSSGSDHTLPVQGAWVQSQVGELRPHMRCVMARTKRLPCEDSDSFKGDGGAGPAAGDKTGNTAFRTFAVSLVRGLRGAFPGSGTCPLHEADRMTKFQDTGSPIS